MDRNRVLELALNELERRKAGIEEEIAAISAEMNEKSPSIQLIRTPGRRGRKKTAAERKAQAERMRAIWAARRARLPKR